METRSKDQGPDESRKAMEIADIRDILNTQRGKNSSRPEMKTQQKTRITTSIVIPAYNEARRMEQALPSLIDCFDWKEEEVIIVDDGSKDDTVKVAETFLGGLPNTQIIRLGTNSGKGAAVRAGIKKARGRVIAYADADMASDPKGFTRLFDALVDCEVAIGSRALPESTVNCRDPSRVLFGRVFNRFVRTVTDLNLSDTQCGFKAFRAPAAKLLFHASKINRYAFDVEILMLANKLGMRAREVPVDWTDVKGSHVRPVADSMPMAADVVRSEILWRNARPVEAVTIISVTNGRRDGPPEVTRALEENLRYCDAVVSWPRGALALLPCLAPEEAALVRDRLATKLTG